MRVAFRTDASWAIGTGHLMRCLTLAEALRNAGAQCRFVCRAHPGNLIEMIQQRGFEVSVLPWEETWQPSETTPRHAHWLGADWRTDAEQTKLSVGETAPDWLIVDHYALDARWESALRGWAKRIMVIDDLADRMHDCDLLLDQNFYKDLEHRYKGLVPDNCQTLLGPTYALLRPEFIEARRRLRQRDGIVKRILVFLGGADVQNVTSKAIRAITLTGQNNIALDVVIGLANPHHDEIVALCLQRKNTCLHIQVDNMATLMAMSDLSIGTGGATTLERCYLGLPTLTLVCADNQEKTTIDLSDNGAIRYIGWADNVSISNLTEAIDEAISCPEKNLEMSQRAMQVMKYFMHASKPEVIAALLRTKR